jgi:hypothetical protein
MGRSATPPLKGFLALQQHQQQQQQQQQHQPSKNDVRINFVFDSILVYKQHANIGKSNFLTFFSASHVIFCDETSMPRTTKFFSSIIPDTDANLNSIFVSLTQKILL